MFKLLQEAKGMINEDADEQLMSELQSSLKTILEDYIEMIHEIASEEDRSSGVDQMESIKKARAALEKAKAWGIR